MKIIDEITEVINSFRRLSGVGICFYDLDNFFHYDTLGTQNNRGHYCDFCKSVRLLKDGRTRCNNSDKCDAILHAKNYQKPFFFKCHIGMYELILPLYYEKSLIGLVFMGQCRIENEDNSKSVYQKAEELGGDGNHFVKLYNLLPKISRENLLDMSKILEHYFKIMIETKGNSAMQSFLLEHTQTSLSDKICSYINEKYMYPITPSQISNELYLNQSYVARVFHNATGQTMTEYINKVRIDNAKLLLDGSSVPISSIAINVGFNDANYFSRIFKKRVGISPEVYRRLKEENKPPN